MNEKNDKYIKLSYIIIVICLIMYILIIEDLQIVTFFTDLKKTEYFIGSWGRYGPIIFIALQVLQVLLFFIPGEIIQISGGFIFGTAIGTLLSIIGITLGSYFSFEAARLLDGKFVNRIVGKRKYFDLKKLLLKPKNELIILGLYILPGFPKDILGYLLGMTDISLTKFLAISVIGRIPGILVTSLIGENFYQNNYMISIYLILVSSIILVIGMKYHDKMLKLFYKKRRREVK